MEIEEEDVSKLMNQSFPSSSMSTFSRFRYFQYVDAVYATRAYPDMVEICKEALKNHPGDPDIRELLGGSECVCSEYVKQSKAMLQAQGETLEDSAWGMIGTKSYPWAPPETRIRAAETMTAANKLLESSSDCLEIRPSAHGGPKAITQCFGMFATRDIKQNEEMLDASTATAVSNKPMTSQYCYNCAATLKKSQATSFSCCPNMKFCGNDCLQIAEDNYHKALCGKDFSELYQAASSQDPQESSKGRDSLMFLRLIAISIQSGTLPLMTPPISWLVANDESPSPIPWSRGANIIGPLKAIEKLGLDIFADEYDTWVLQTMWYRVTNNARTRNTFVQQKIVNALYSFFNHSCEPSTLDQSELSPTILSTSRAVMIATKDIKAGEEVYSTYLNPIYLDAPKAIRQKELERGGWLDARGCRCKRCLAER